MARASARLAPINVPRLAKKPGMHCDGGGLYLRSAPPAAASWVLRYMIDGRARTMGLGSYPEIDLKIARERALEARRLKADGTDPIEARREAKAAKRLKDAKAMTFKQCALAYIASHRDGWRNEKHAAQWVSTLKTYVYPLIGDLPVATIDAGLVIEVLEQEVGPPEKRARLWIANNDTASRVRGRIEAVLGWAAARKLRSDDNPARWQGQLSHHLPPRSRVTKVKHHAALPYDAMPDLMRLVREQHGISAKVMEFTILTAARTGEALGAKWGEFDLANKVWVVPGDRMKAGKDHKVPLADPVVTLLERLKPEENDKDASPYVFPGAKVGKPLSGMAMLMLLRRMDRADLTTHGFRSTFRDWAAEATSHPNEVAEMALAHTLSNKVEAAYRRGDLYQKRIQLMDDWSDYCSSKIRADSDANANNDDILGAA